MRKRTRADAYRAAVILFSGGVVACSQAPEAAPEFTLPISRVTTAPPSSEETAATTSGPHQLRYVAVPSGQKVAGMAHARIVVKHKKATRDRHPHKNVVARPASVKKPTETAAPPAKP
jgi:hypothetical protein